VRYPDLYIPAAILVGRAKEAVSVRKLQVSSWRRFAKTLPSPLVREWTSVVQEWEKDKSRPNPFEYSGKREFGPISICCRVNHQSVITESSVREELAREEEEGLKAGNIAVVHDKVSPSEFILRGLTLEDRM
jgi:hypothetical protein